MNTLAATAAPTASAKTWTKTADRPLRSWRKSASIWVFAHFVGVPVPWHAVRQTDGADLLAFEHQRLLALAAAGERVPTVLAFDGFSLTTSDIGDTLDHVLHRSPEAGRLALMCAASADLAAFHTRGHWHGGAQTRNLTWNGEHFARLDFEERLQPGMALATVQVYDALQLLLSTGAVPAAARPRRCARGASGLCRRRHGRCCAARLHRAPAAASGLGVQAGGVVTPAGWFARTDAVAHGARRHEGVCRAGRLIGSPRWPGGSWLQAKQKRGLESPFQLKSLMMTTAKKPTAFNRALTPSAELAAVIGATPQPRTEVVKLMWEYIKANNLQNPKNKRNILADAKLKAVFGKDEVTMFEMTGLVGKHLS